VQHIDLAVVDRNRFWISSTGGILQTPDDLAVRISGQQMAAALGTVASQVHPLAIGFDVARYTMIAEPAGCGI